MIAHGGNLEKLAQLANCRKEELLDFSVNMHPLGMPDGLLAACQAALNDLEAYPEPHAESLAKLAAARWGRSEEEFLFGNGSTELLYLLPKVVPGEEVVVVTPGYLEYEENCRKAGKRVRRFALSEEAGFQLDARTLSQFLHGGELVILGTPNNPTGQAVPAVQLHHLAAAHPDCFFLIDEAFADFTNETLLALAPLPNLAISRSLTKFYACAGLRIGFLCASPAVVNRLREEQPPWSVGTVAAAAARFLLEHPREEHGETAQLRNELTEGLRQAGLKVYPSAANYLLCRGKNGTAQRLLSHRIAVRTCADYPGLDERYFRVAVRSSEDNALLLKALQTDAPALVKRHRPALMLQGTCSNAGKSVLCAAFCRILLQDGFSVAPFKAQNMSLNSYVTPDGGEIGRAQAVQAEACRLDPDVRMNPILLKPDSDLGSQVVVLGHPIGNYRVRDYFRKKRALWEQVTAAYDSLATEHDCMVLEGAGSPGEINLKASDVVNMRMASHANAAVLLVGDIDRGGVYASFLGTFQTFEPWERRLLHGFLVNKFRGDPTLLADAHAWMEKMTGRPVLGVIDYQTDMGLPEEDSVNFSFVRPVARETRTLDIALIALGHTANFTDFAPLEAEPDVRLRIVHSVAELGTPDLLILPGSKNVPGDMAALEASGLAAAIRAFRGPVVAICGGLQMLGQACHDPLSLESNAAYTPCLGLLPFETTFRREKTVRRTTARLPDGTAVSGYEIHHGETSCELPPIVADDGRAVGFVAGRFFATYLHGVFDEDPFRRKYLDDIRALKGWPPRRTLVHYGLEEALDRLAAHVRSRVDMPALYRKLGLR